MRKPRDFDAELVALTAKARELRTRKVAQLGELVIASGADTLSIERLAGALLAAVATTDAKSLEGWREQGAAFFHGASRRARMSASASDGGAAAGNGVTSSTSGEPRA